MRPPLGLLLCPQDVYEDANYTVMVLRIKVINDTLLVNHVSSSEEVLGSIPSAPKGFIKGFRSTMLTFEDCHPIGASYTVHYAVSQGTNSVICLFELMRVSIAGSKHFLR